MKVELNVTMACNAECVHCNRLCDLYPDRTEHMTAEQVYRMVEQVRAAEETVIKCKVVGGEPFLNPEIRDICELLSEADVIEKVIIETNRILPIPQWANDLPRTRIQGTLPKDKVHVPATWSPVDYNQPTQLGCMGLHRCGYSLDKYGWLPCSPAIMLVRLFGMWELYRLTLPRFPWELLQLCHHCIASAPVEWTEKHTHPLADVPDADRNPSKSWAKAMQSWDPEKFYSLMEEF